MSDPNIYSSIWHHELQWYIMHHTIHVSLYACKQIDKQSRIKKGDREACGQSQCQREQKQDSREIHRAKDQDGTLGKRGSKAPLTDSYVKV